MKRSIIAAVAATGLASALLVSTAGLAMAADNGTTPSPTSSSKVKGDGPVAGLVKAGTITGAQAKAIHQALAQSKGTAGKGTALASLVTSGTITQAQADAISAAPKGGMKALVTAGTITKEQAKAVHTARGTAHDNHASARTSALAGLVTSGTITQAQADAVAAALAAKAAQH